MKKYKIIYWIATSIAAFMALMAGVMYFTNPMVTEGFKHLGFPDYFRVELGTAKILGAIVLLLPMISSRIKEWTYAGFGIVYISAAIAHAVVDGPAGIGGPLISMAFLVISYLCFTKLNSIRNLPAAA
ncbi:MAG TPA: DoxX family protein [Bacteroidia bacterium]